jgi:hypothetical protein
MAERSEAGDIPVAQREPDYARVIALGNAVVDAERVMMRFAFAGAGTAPTRVADAASDPLAMYAFHLGASYIGASLDHLRTVAQVVQNAVIPAFALMSLLRSGHECALVAQWFLDPSISDDDRIARGVGGQVADHDERRKIEVVVGRAASTRGKLAADRIATLLDEARQRGLTKVNKKGDLVPAVPLPSVVELFDEFESVEGLKGSWLYSYYSGFAHGKQWAVVLNATQQTDFDQHDHAVARVESNDHIMVALMERATAAVLRAVNSYTLLRTQAH